MYLLRPWQEQDAEALARYAADSRVAADLRDLFPHPYTEGDARAYIAECIRQEGAGRLCRAIVEDGQAVGSVEVCLGVDVFRKSGELGYWLGVPFWGRGIMTAAVEELCREAFARLDIVRIQAQPFARNTGSRRVLEKAGFTLEGVLRQSVCKDGEILDSCLYAMVKEEVS